MAPTPTASLLRYAHDNDAFAVVTVWLLLGNCFARVVLHVRFAW